MSDAKAGKSRLSLYGIVALILLIFVIYSWKTVEIRRLQEQMATREGELEEASQKALAEQRERMLRLAGVPLGWAVRTEIMKENFSLIDDYFRRFVKELGVSRIFLVGEDGTVVVASDKKLEGEPASSLLSDEVMRASEIRVEHGEGELLLAVPIMGLDSKLGILALGYSE